MWEGVEALVYSHNTDLNFTAVLTEVISLQPLLQGQGRVMCRKERKGDSSLRFSEPPAGPCSLKNYQLPFHLARPSPVIQASFLLLSSPSP